MTTIDCAGSKTYEDYARCIIRDDTTTKTQITTLVILAMMITIMALCIKNLIALKRQKELKKVKGITILNFVILAFAVCKRSFSHIFSYPLGISS